MTVGSHLARAFLFLFPFLFPFCSHFHFPFPIAFPFPFPFPFLCLVNGLSVPAAPSTLVLLWVRDPVQQVLGGGTLMGHSPWDALGRMLDHPTAPPALLPHLLPADRIHSLFSVPDHFEREPRLRREKPEKTELGKQLKGNCLRGAHSQPHQHSLFTHSRALYPHRAAKFKARCGTQSMNRKGLLYSWNLCPVSVVSDASRL